MLILRGDENRKRDGKCNGKLYEKGGSKCRDTRDRIMWKCRTMADPKQSGERAKEKNKKEEDNYKLLFLERY